MVQNAQDVHKQSILKTLFEEHVPKFFILTVLLAWFVENNCQPAKSFMFWTRTGSFAKKII